MYVVKLTVIVRQSGGARTRDFATVHARKAPIVIDIGPDQTLDEGQVATFIAKFSHAEWLDKHTATFSWGDDQTDTAGIVTETNDAPAAKGTIEAAHAFGDKGVYDVRLTVRDEDGGTQKEAQLAAIQPGGDPSQELRGLGNPTAALVAYPITSQKEYTRERVPLEWATTQNSLGIVLQRLGGRENVTDKLEQAVAAEHAGVRGAIRSWRFLVSLTTITIRALSISPTVKFRSSDRRSPAP